MGRNILAVLVGLVAAMATFFLAEQIGHSIFPMPTGLNMEDKAALKTFMESLPIGAYLLVFGGWLFGSLEAGFIAQKISQQQNNLLPIIIGSILTASGALNFYLIPHPMWFVIAGLVVFIPSVVVGWNLALRMAVGQQEAP